MTKVIIVNHDYTCLLLTPVLSAQKEEETFQEFLYRLVITYHPDHLVWQTREDDNLPDGKVDQWRYNPDTTDIETLPPGIDWVGLAEAYSSINSSVKDGLDKYYGRLLTAITDEDEPYIQLIYQHMLNVADNGIDQSLIDQVVLKFGEYNLILPV
jgi:hypothetical protein